MIITYSDIILFIAGQFKKALSTRGGDDVRHIKINEPQTVKYTGNAIGMLFLNTRKLEYPYLYTWPII